jgi:hypothetical protein
MAVANRGIGVSVGSRGRSSLDEVGTAQRELPGYASPSHGHSPMSSSRNEEWDHRLCRTRPDRRRCDTGRPSLSGADPEADFAATLKPMSPVADVPARRLLAVLANPPSATLGERTRSRVAMAARIIGCDDVVVANLFSYPSRDVTELSVIGVDDAGWTKARCDLARKINQADEVLLGWGCSEPVGLARMRHRAQVTWLLEALSTRSVRIWTVSNAPRHPSRWQRHTARAHPGLPFAVALALSLQSSNPPTTAATEAESAKRETSGRGPRTASECGPNLKQAGNGEQCVQAYRAIYGSFAAPQKCQSHRLASS